MEEDDRSRGDGSRCWCAWGEEPERERVIFTTRILFFVRRPFRRDPNVLKENLRGVDHRTRPVSNPNAKGNARVGLRCRRRTKIPKSDHRVTRLFSSLSGTRNNDDHTAPCPRNRCEPRNSGPSSTFLQRFRAREEERWTTHKDSTASEFATGSEESPTESQTFSVRLSSQTARSSSSVGSSLRARASTGGSRRSSRTDCSSRRDLSRCAPRGSSARQG